MGAEAWSERKGVQSRGQQRGVEAFLPNYGVLAPR
jgi:hypothetical protein